MKVHSIAHHYARLSHAESMDRQPFALLIPTPTHTAVRSSQEPNTCAYRTALAMAPGPGPREGSEAAGGAKAFAAYLVVQRGTG